MVGYNNGYGGHMKLWIMIVKALTREKEAGEGEEDDEKNVYAWDTVTEEGNVISVFSHPINNIDVIYDTSIPILLSDAVDCTNK